MQRRNSDNMAPPKLRGAIEAPLSSSPEQASQLHDNNLACSPEDNSNEFFYDEDFSIQFDANIADVDIDTLDSLDLNALLSRVREAENKDRGMTASKSDSCLYQIDLSGSDANASQDQSVSSEIDKDCDCVSSGEMSELQNEPLFSPNEEQLKIQQLADHLCASNSGSCDGTFSGSFSEEGKFDFDWKANKNRYMLSFVRSPTKTNSDTDSYHDSVPSSARDSMNSWGQRSTGSNGQKYLWMSSGSNRSFGSRSSSNNTTPKGSPKRTCKKENLTTWKQVHEENKQSSKADGFTTWKDLKEAQQKVHMDTNSAGVRSKSLPDLKSKPITFYTPAVMEKDSMNNDIGEPTDDGTYISYEQNIDYEENPKTKRYSASLFELFQRLRSQCDARKIMPSSDEESTTCIQIERNESMVSPTTFQLMQLNGTWVSSSHTTTGSEKSHLSHMSVPTSQSSPSTGLVSWSTLKNLQAVHAVNVQQGILMDSLQRSNKGCGTMSPFGNLQQASVQVGSGELTMSKFMGPDNRDIAVQWPNPKRDCSIQTSLEKLLSLHNKAQQTSFTNSCGTNTAKQAIVQLRNPGTGETRQIILKRQIEPEIIKNINPDRKMSSSLFFSNQALPDLSFLSKGMSKSASITIKEGLDKLLGKPVKKKGPPPPPKPARLFAKRYVVKQENSKEDIGKKDNVKKESTKSENTGKKNSIAVPKTTGKPQDATGKRSSIPVPKGYKQGGTKDKVLSPVMEQPKTNIGAPVATSTPKKQQPTSNAGRKSGIPCKSGIPGKTGIPRFGKSGGSKPVLKVTTGTAEKPRSRESSPGLLMPRGRARSASTSTNGSICSSSSSGIDGGGYDANKTSRDSADMGYNSPGTSDTNTNSLISESESENGSRGNLYSRQDSGFDSEGKAEAKKDAEKDSNASPSDSVETLKNESPTKTVSSIVKMRNECSDITRKIENSCTVCNGNRAAQKEKNMVTSVPLYKEPNFKSKGQYKTVDYLQVSPTHKPKHGLKCFHLIPKVRKRWHDIKTDNGRSTSSDEDFLREDDLKGKKPLKSCLVKRKRERTLLKHRSFSDPYDLAVMKYSQEGQTRYQLVSHLLTDQPCPHGLGMGTIGFSSLQSEMLDRSEKSLDKKSNVGHLDAQPKVIQPPKCIKDVVKEFEAATGEIVLPPALPVSPPEFISMLPCSCQYQSQCVTKNPCSEPSPESIEDSQSRAKKSVSFCEEIYYHSPHNSPHTSPRKQVRPLLTGSQSAPNNLNLASGATPIGMYMLLLYYRLLHQTTLMGYIDGIINKIVISGW